MNPRVATILFLVLIGCQVFSVHGGDVERSGGDRRLGEEEELKQVAGLCVDSPCDADPNRTCFCCTRLANEPCYDTLKQCVSVCPNCNFITCPPPRPPPKASLQDRRTRLGLPPASS